MFIINCENFLIKLNVVNNDILIKHIIKCLIAIIILIKLQFIISFNFYKKINYFLNMIFYLKYRILIN